jgi:hypothetical protein
MQMMACLLKLCGKEEDTSLTSSKLILCCLVLMMLLQVRSPSTESTATTSTMCQKFNICTIPDKSALVMELVGEKFWKRLQ